jgi:hypothetical protein
MTISNATKSKNYVEDEQLSSKLSPEISELQGDKKYKEII